MLCPNCAYDLRGQQRNEFGTFRCPECGETSAGTASRGEVIASYRSWRGAFGGGQQTLGARYLDSPAILRTVQRRWLVLVITSVPFPFVMLITSMFIVHTRYERWWSPINQPGIRMDVDTVEVAHRFIPDPNDDAATIRYFGGTVRGDRCFHIEPAGRSISVHRPRPGSLSRAARTIGACVILGTVPFVTAMLMALVLLANSPAMPRRRQVRRSFGMAGNVLIPISLQFGFLMFDILLGWMRMKGNTPPPLSLVPTIALLNMSWVSLLIARMPFATLPDRDQFSRFAYGATIFISSTSAQWYVYVRLL